MGCIILIIHSKFYRNIITLNQENGFCSLFSFKISIKILIFNKSKKINPENKMFVNEMRIHASLIIKYTAKLLLPFLNLNLGLFKKLEQKMAKSTHTCTCIPKNCLHFYGLFKRS